MRVAVTTNMMAPYKTPLFERVSKLLGGEFLVVYETPMESNRRWEPPRTLPFDYATLKSVSIDLRRWFSDTYLHVPRNPLEAIRAFRPDVVVMGGGAWTSPTNLAVLGQRKRFGWRVVPWWGSFSHRRGILRTALNPIARKFVRSGDAWIAAGSRAKAELIDYGAAPEKITIAREITGRSVPADSLRQQQGHNPRPLRYLFVGQLIERKGVEVLLEAFDRVRNGELWIAGDGPLVKQVEAASRRDPRIRYFGHRSGDELSDLYQKADIFVLPSLYEVWGIVVNEALMYGLPVIATTEVGAAADLIEDGQTGMIVDPRDVTQLAEAMATVGSWHPHRFSACAEINGAKIEAWSVDRAADGIVCACELATSNAREGICA
jgi:glycosyltransferase involved in cell wall biosynthesis